MTSVAQGNVASESSTDSVDGSVISREAGRAAATGVQSRGMVVVVEEVDVVDVDAGAGSIGSATVVGTVLAVVEHDATARQPASVKTTGRRVDKIAAPYPSSERCGVVFVLTAGHLRGPDATQRSGECDH